MRDRLQDMRQIHGLIAPRRRFRREIAGQEVRSIGFDEKAVARYVAHDISQMMPAAFVANPSGNADVEPEVEIGACFVETGGETVRDAADEVCAKLAQHFDEGGVRIALMQEYRLAKLDRQLELTPEGRDLCLVGREVSEIVEPAFADGGDFRRACERAQFRELRPVELVRVVRMHTGRATKALGGTLYELNRALRTFYGAARDDHPRDTDRFGARDHFVAIVIEAVMREVDADVDDWDATRSDCIRIGQRVSKAIVRAGGGADATVRRRLF